jgi:hypothetical protein
MLRKIRITLAAIMMVMVTLLFLYVSGVLHHYLAWTARIQFLPALLALNVVVSLTKPHQVHMCVCSTVRMSTCIYISQFFERLF